MEMLAAYPPRRYVTTPRKEVFKALENWGQGLNRRSVPLETKSDEEVNTTMSACTSNTIRRRVICPFVAIIMLAAFLGACGGPSSSDREMVLETLNDSDEIAERNASIGDIAFEDREDHGDYISWPFEATIVDEDGQQIGVIRGKLDKQGSSAMVETSPIEWD